MACAVEMSRCDECGREVPRFEVRMVTRGKERALLCEPCRGEGTASPPPHLPPACEPQR